MFGGGVLVWNNMEYVLRKPLLELLYYLAFRIFVDSVFLIHFLKRRAIRSLRDLTTDKLTIRADDSHTPRMCVFSH